MPELKNGLIIIESGDAEQPYNYSVGPHGSRFFVELRDNKKLLGVKCPSCSKVYCPPRPICGPCYKGMDEFVEVGPEGKIDTYTILRFQFLDPQTGEKKPVPYGYGFIRLDGSDCNFQHFIAVDDEEKLFLGARVRPVFAENRTGTLKDIKHFEVVE